MANSKLLIAILLLQVAILAGFWLGRGPAPAAAQIPDGGAQRLQMIQELQQINAKLDAMLHLMDSGQLQVRSHPTDER